MRFTLTEEQEMLKKAARDFLTDKCPKSFVNQMEESEIGYSREVWQEMADLGWMGLAFPEKYGGGDMSFLDLAVLLEEMGRACLPGPFFSRKRATGDDGSVVTFQARARLDSDVDVEYYRNGGILQTVLRKMARGEM